MRSASRIRLMLVAIAAVGAGIALTGTAQGDALLKLVGVGAFAAGLAGVLALRIAFARVAARRHASLAQVFASGADRP